MKSMKRTTYLVVSIAGALLAALAVAQQVNGILGSPSATTTISKKQLPPPDPKFDGVIKNDALQSKPWWRRASCHPRARRTCSSSSPMMPASGCPAPSGA